MVPGVYEWGVGETLALSLAEWIPASRAVRGRRRRRAGASGEARGGAPALRLL